jgi:hypothetical protein
MAGLTNDIKITRYGSGDGCQPEAYPVGANAQLYSGEVALVSGSGAVTTGYLKNAASPGNADVVVGMIGDPTGGVYQTGPGFTGGTADGSVWSEVLTGAFFFQSGTGPDALSAATNGLTVYYGGENANGPIANATGAGVLPVLGVQLPQDPGIAGGCTPGANYFPVIVAPAKGRP